MPSVARACIYVAHRFVSLQPYLIPKPESAPPITSLLYHPHQILISMASMTMKVCTIGGSRNIGYLSSLRLLRKSICVPHVDK